MYQPYVYDSLQKEDHRYKEQYRRRRESRHGAANQRRRQRRSRRITVGNGYANHISAEDNRLIYVNSKCINYNSDRRSEIRLRQTER